MSQLVDCYWLVDSRDSKKVNSFLDKFLPRRDESAIDYPLPQLTDSPEQIFNSSKLLISYLEINKTTPYSIYWKNLDISSKFQNGMIFYTDDGKMIFGLSIKGKFPDETAIINDYSKIGLFLGSIWGCITVEEPPPSNSLEFIEFCKNRYIP